MFTNGSKMYVDNGASVYVVKGNIRETYRIADECSVFQSEILGIIRATELMTTLLNRTIESSSILTVKFIGSHRTSSNLVYLYFTGYRCTVMWMS